MLGKELKAINYYPFNLLSVVSKFFKKLVNYRLVGHLVKHGLLSNFQCGFRSSWSTAENLLYLVPDNIARAFNRSGATRAVALDRSTVFDKVWHAGLLHKLKSHEILGQVFGVISSFLSNRQPQVVLNEKSLQKYPVKVGVLQSFFLGSRLH